jgi:hypothetical protein
MMPGDGGMGRMDTWVSGGPASRAWYGAQQAPLHYGGPNFCQAFDVALQQPLAGMAMRGPGPDLRKRARGSEKVFWFSQFSILPIICPCSP